MTHRVNAGGSCSDARRAARFHAPEWQARRWKIRRLERVKGIEPSSSAWKAVALPLSYTRAAVCSPHERSDMRGLRATNPDIAALIRATLGVDSPPSLKLRRALLWIARTRDPEKWWGR